MLQGQDKDTLLARLLADMEHLGKGHLLTFLCLIAVNPNIALRADAEERGLINPSQAGAPILTVVHVAEITWK